ncbi:hypothetical protein EYF80_039569 [Liparis tanakae]|uniref:Secreted protein n=1 Tax=Liparis tanakae TaxID=230148 RepID=A0A4Z2GC84_9TELE|nr:hypothetical protein EYF80_039569 [Liparis tanakae]
MWRFRWLVCVKPFLHTAHLCGRVPWCVSRCVCRWLGCLNSLPQCGQACGFTPLWPRMCVTRLYLDVYDLSHMRHFQRFSPSPTTTPPDLAGLEVAADGFLLLRGLHHVVPLAAAVLPPASPVAPHRPLALRPPVAVLASSVADLRGGWGRGRRRVSVGAAGRVAVALPAALVGAPEGRRVHLDQTASGRQIVQHVDAGGHPRVQHLPLHVGRGHLAAAAAAALEAVAIGADHLCVRVLRRRRRGRGRALLPAPLATAGLHRSVFAQVVSEVIPVGSDELVGVLVVDSLYLRRGGLFGLAGVEAVGCDGGAEHFILGDETEHGGLGQGQHDYRVCLGAGVHQPGHHLGLTSTQAPARLLLGQKETHGDRR